MAAEEGIDARLSDVSDGEGEARPAGEDDDHDEIDSESDEEPHVPPGRRNLAHLLRGALQPRIVGWPVGNRGRAPDSNDALVDYLNLINAVTKPEVSKAMKLCPRDKFIPGGIGAHPDVFADCPLHVTGLNFNISAPHMHATCLQALDLEPGHKVLDIGSGSGLLSAYAAVVVGKSGSVLGVDSMRAATKLARRNLRRLAAGSRAFADAAGECSFRTHNIFMPAKDFQGQFDRIVAGASCPKDRLACLVSLLKPGGVLVTPLIPSELRKITRTANGYESSCISQVRFSDLELPGELEVLQALINFESQSHLKAPVLPSTFASDVASISGSSSSALPGSSLGSDHMSIGCGASAGSPAQASWPRRVSKFLTACSSGSSSGDSERSSLEGMSVEEGESPTHRTTGLDVDELGPFDCTFHGAGWSLQAHKAVLRNRSELFRAQSASGMRDAEAVEMSVPEQFSKEALEMFLQYCYGDRLESGLSAESKAACLAAAVYYGAPHLVHLCELSLADDLLVAGEEAYKLSPSLLALSDELGLAHLKARAVNFIAMHHDAVAETEAYQGLTKAQVGLVASHASEKLRHFHDLVSKLRGRRVSPYDLISSEQQQEDLSI